MTQHAKGLLAIPVSILAVSLAGVFLLPLAGSCGLPRAFSPEDQSAAGWQPSGGPYEQVIYALALGRSPGQLYVGTWGEGLYRSIDSGLTWRPASSPGDQGRVTDPTKARVRALAVGPDGQTIYLSRWGTGVFRSDDGGTTWESVSGPGNGILPLHDDLNVDGLLIDRDVPAVIYQATWGGFYKSIDKGAFWEHKDVAPEMDEWEDKRVHSLVQATDGALYAGTSAAAVFKSTNGGESWQGLAPLGTGQAGTVYALVTRDGVLWAGTQDGVYRTEDGGQSWQQVIAGFADDSRARTVQALVADNAGNLYAGTVDFGVYRSQDGGDSWQTYNDGLRGYALAILSLVYDGRADVLYATTYGAGVYQNKGDGWVPINGEGEDHLPTPAFQIQSVAFVGPDRDVLLVGTVGTFVGGVYASTDRGQSWRRWNQALPIGAARNVADIVVLGEGQTVVLAGGTGVFRSTNGGETWDKVTANLRSGDHRAISLVQGRRNPKLLFVALRLESEVGIYRSVDGGETWQLRSLLDGVDDLSLSDDDTSLCVVHWLRGLSCSGDQGASWQQVTGETPLQGYQVVESKRGVWQNLVLGFPRQSIHVRALDGIRSSYDAGETWRSSLRGQFRTLLVDTERPGVLYATSLTDTVPLQISSPSVISDTSDVDQTTPYTVTLAGGPQYSFWASLDDGRSWRQVNSSARPLTVLALDPLDRNRLFAGTIDDGVYAMTLDLPASYMTVRAMLGLLAFVVFPAFVLGALLGLYLYFGLGLGMWLYPWQVWALLLRVPAWRLVSAPRRRLGSLEQLVARIAADRGGFFTDESLWEELQSLGALSSFDQVRGALSELLIRGLLERDKAGKNYRFSLIALARLVALHFDREALIREVRTANVVASNAERFFEQAGFVVWVLRNRLSLWPESPHYRSLGRMNAWLQVQGPLDERVVARLANDAGTGSRDLGFVVIDEIPTPGAYRAMQEARLVPLSGSEIQRALDRREAGLTLQRAIREGRGQEDLFDRHEPLPDLLTHFGRTKLLTGWQKAIEQGEDVFFWGLPSSGRTSALWWLRAKLPGHWLKGYVDLRFRGLDWRPVLHDLLADLLLDLRRVPRSLRGLPELDDVLEACGSALHLRTGLEYLADKALGAQPERFVIFLDGAWPGAVLNRCQELAEQWDQVSLVVSWDGLPSGPEDVNHSGWLSPLTSAESYALLKTTGARIGLEFAEQDLVVLDAAAGGHPFLLRQLGSHAARMAGRPEQALAGRAFQPGEWPELPALIRFPADTVLETYLQQRADSLIYLWNALSSEARRNVRLLVASQRIDPYIETIYKDLGLLLQDENRVPRLRIQMLGRWLRERWS